MISLQFNRLSRIFSNTTIQKHQFFSTQPSLWSNFNMHTWLLKKTIALTIPIFVSKVMSLLFNMLSRFDIPFLPRSNILSQLSTMTHPSWVTLHGMAYSFIELHKSLHHKAVTHEDVNTLNTTKLYKVINCIPCIFQFKKALCRNNRPYFIKEIHFRH